MSTFRVVCLALALASGGPGVSIAGDDPGSQAAAQRALAIVTEICVLPTSPGDIIAAGDRVAAADNWMRDEAHSGPHRGPGQAVDQQPFFVDRRWTIRDATFKGALTLRIVGPDYPGQRLTACSLSTPGHFYDGFVAATREAMKFGPGVVKNGPDRTLTTWPLSGDSKTSDTGYRAMTVAVRKWPSGWVTDIGLAEVKSLNGMLLGQKF